MSTVEKKIPRILIVDDDQLLNELFCSFLQSRGLQTLAAHSIHEAKCFLKVDSGIDLILLDYQLGDGVGMDLLASNALSIHLDSIPVIMISANESPEFLEQCFLAGVNDYIIKPVNLSLLALKVEALIKSIDMQRLIRSQKNELENYKIESEREEQVAKFTYEYLMGQNSHEYAGVEVWLKSFAAFSGDMTLVKKSQSGNLYFILADATGHGLSAAITILPVVTIFNSMVAKGFHIQRIVTEINRKLVTNTPGDRFVAAIVIEINPFSRECNIWNGGMPPVLWINQGKVVRQFHSTNMALGIVEENIFDASFVTFDLPDEGFMFACSDGLTEQENADHEPFSLQRVLNIIAQQPENLVAEIAKSLAVHAGTEEYKDDVSINVIRPTQVFNGLTDSIAVAPMRTATLDAANCFEWHIKLSGHQLESCEIPPLCNHFLQQVGIDQQLCQKVFTVLAEMISNALDHGVLDLSSSIKEEPDGFMKYFYEREARLKTLTDKDFIKLSMQWLPDNTGGSLAIEVEDSGAGFIPIVRENKSAPQYSGRGSGLINKLSEVVEIIAPGNKIRATIK